MQKIISLIVVFGVFFSSTALAQSNWLVRTKGKSTQQTLYQDGSIVRTNRGDPKTTFDQSENAGHKRVKYDLDISDWSVAAYGISSPTDYFVNYKEPDGNLRVIVYYDWKAMTAVSASKMVYGDMPGGYAYEEVPIESVKVPKYCRDNYGCIG